MATATNEGILFSFAEMQHEIENMTAVARKFLEPATDEQIIRPWLQQLRNFETSSPGSSLSWQIAISRPITTIRSEGEYEPDDQGEHTVVGTLSSIWEIRIPKLAARKSMKKHSRNPNFELWGCASTRVIIWQFNPDGDLRELARWRFEVGDSQSPGCHFHIQVLGEEQDQHFPHSMAVPRLPGLLLTPMDSLEFLLAEIFQKRWRQHASQQNDAVRNWSTCQRKRLMNLLGWQREKIRTAAGSPWTSFKGQKPTPDLFLADVKR
jgi:hypothetical protein